MLTFGNKTYPKYGNVIILAGGSGSGKSFQLENMLCITGKQLDINSLKTFVLNSKFFQKEILRQYNVDITKISLDNPNNIVLATHIGTASVFNVILMNPELLLNYLDGDIYISFNQAGIDTHVVNTNTNKIFVTDFEYIQIKEQCKSIISVNEIKQELLDKISDYVPTPQLKYNWKRLKEFK